MTSRAHTLEQGLAAIEALGYTRGDRVLSVLVNASEISVRRISKEAGGWAIVEDRTILKPDGNLLHEHADDAAVGPLETSAEVRQGD